MPSGIDHQITGDNPTVEKRQIDCELNSRPVYWPLSCRGALAVDDCTGAEMGSAQPVEPEQANTCGGNKVLIATAIPCPPPQNPEAM